MSRRHGRRAAHGSDPRDRGHVRVPPAASPHGARPDAQEAPLLVVAVCAGHRCAGLRQLAAPTRPDAPPPAGPGEEDPVRAAVRGRPHAVLMSTGCQGRCHLGPVATVGNALPVRTGQSSGSLSWTGSPVALGPLGPGSDQALGEWVRTAAPATADLPPALRAALPAGPGAPRRVAGRDPGAHP